MLDYLVVGSGLFGSVFAREMAEKGKNILIIDKRNHIGGNIFTERIENIDVHKYGAHIFHTNEKKIWDYVNKYSEFNRFTNSPLARYKDKIYNLPFNMNTFSKMWNISTPEEAKLIIDKQRSVMEGTIPSNLEEQALNLVGEDIYKMFIKNYTEKQWGRKCRDLPAFIINRIPVRLTYDNNYFNDRYQGIPINGYTELVRNILNHKNISVELQSNYFERRSTYDSCSKKIVFTGMIDEFFNYKYGYLQYRSLNFKNILLEARDFQGNAVVNYTDDKDKFTRIIEHKHFNLTNQSKTIITKEFPTEWRIGLEPFYPINDSINTRIYNCYHQEANKQNKVIFGGRLGSYKYFDMHQVIKFALNTVKKEIE